MLARIFLLIAVLIMPLGMTPAAATAHDERVMASMPIGHCDEGTKKQMKGGFAECTMGCSAALPAAEARNEEPPHRVCMPIRAAVALVLHGLHPETATPPPRHS